MNFDNSITVEHIYKKYKDFSLEDVSFTLPKGCIMGFIGENGAGKSTTIKIILDLVKKDKGNINLMGKAIDSQGILDDIGVVFDENCFPDDMTASNIDKSLSCIYKNWDGRAFKNYLKRFSIPEKQAVKTFSRGMKMKLSISAALSHGAKLLILDEATSGLDPVIREQILDVFMEFIQNEENSILLSSHIVSDLEKICDYITFIHKGKIFFTMEKDRIIEEYGILKCSEKELETVRKDAVESVRRNKFGVEALVKRKRLRTALTVDRPTLEEVMLFIIMGNKI